MYCFFSPQQRLKETPTFNSETDNTINNVTVFTRKCLRYIVH